MAFNHENLSLFLESPKGDLYQSKTQGVFPEYIIRHLNGYMNHEDFKRLAEMTILTKEWIQNNGIFELLEIDVFLEVNENYAIRHFHPYYCHTMSYKSGRTKMPPEILKKLRSLRKMMTKIATERCRGDFKHLDLLWPRVMKGSKKTYFMDSINKFIVVELPFIRSAIYD